MNEPLVSICCITYNHAPFIRKCLDGFLMQQTTFPIEILIHDDASTDGTTEIVREYESKYPDLIFPIYEEVNQYQNGHAGDIDFFNYKRARGKYIAYCEGDDYWTDPLKLQKQVDFMEANPEYSVCFHEARIFETWSHNMRPPLSYPGKPGDDMDITLELFLRSNIGQPLTMLFRTDKYNYEWQKHYDNYCDTIEIFHLLCVGKGRFLRFCGGQYNLQSNGVSASCSDVDRWEDTITDFIQMYKYTGEEIVKNYLFDTALWGFDLCNRNGLRYLAWKKTLSVCNMSFPLGVKVYAIQIKREFKSLFKSIW